MIVWRVCLFAVLAVVAVVLTKRHNLIKKSTEYLQNTYDFNFSIGKIQYDITFDRYIVTIMPTDVSFVTSFNLSLSKNDGIWTVDTDSYIEETLIYRIKEKMRNELHNILGSSVLYSAELSMSRLITIPSDFTTATDLNEILSLEDNENRLYVKFPEYNENINTKILEALSFIKEKKYQWRYVSFVFPAENNDKLEIVNFNCQKDILLSVNDISAHQRYEFTKDINFS